MVTGSQIEPGQVVAGRYRVESAIGEGGMGVVYRVRHVHTDEALAMKVLHAQALADANAVERFRREARAPARIASEHVARVTDADTAPELGDAPFYVMELLHGMDLERLVNETGPLAPALVVEVLRQAASALDGAHTMGIVHRDLKPENLFLTRRQDGAPWIKLLDFGIARIAEHGAPTHKKTQAGYVFGTPAYMSPEQALGDVEHIGPGTDIWALGLVAFKLLTGQDFWNAPTLTQLYALTVSAPIPKPSEQGASFGPAFDRWFAGCVTRPVADRFRTAGEAVIALAAALDVALVPTLAPPSDGTRPSSGNLGATWQLRTSAPTPLSRAPSFAPGLVAGSGFRRWALPAAAFMLSAFVLLWAALGSRLTSRRAAGLPTAAPVTLARPSDSSLGPPEKPAGSSEDAAPPQGSAGPGSESAEAAPVASLAGADAPTKPGAARDRTPRTPPLSRGQQQRLGVLARLCGQGTFTPDECRAKQASILRER
jgi:serine/threonine protein kinase